MFDNLEPIVREAVMKILVAVYETGFVEEVNLRVVYDLFGVELEGDEDNIVSFTSKQWAEDYVRFTQGIDEDDDITVIHVEAGEPVPAEVRAKLESIGVDVDKLESGEMFEELDEQEATSEDMSLENWNPGKTAH